MWVLQWLPDSLLEFIIFSILGIGAISTIVSLFLINPLLRLMPGLAGTYRILQLVSVLIFLTGVYLWGGYSTEMIWRDRVKELQSEIAVAEERAAEKNVEIQKEIVYKDKIVVEKGKSQIEYVEKIVQGPERVKEITKDMSTEERAKFESKVKELEDSIKNCPVPQIVVEEHNKAVRMIKDTAKAPNKEETKK